MPNESTEALEEWQKVSTRVEQWLKDSEELRGMLNLSDEALGKLSKVNAWVGTAIGVLQLAGIFPEGPNPIKELYDALDHRMQEILAAERGADLRRHLTDIDELVHKAVASAKGAREFIRRGRPGDADDVLDFEDGSSREAVEGLIDYKSAKWKHLFWPELSGEIQTPKEGADFVWDYRWALPAALKAIAARLAVFDAIDPDHRKSGRYSEDIRDYADRLQEIHRKITEGIGLIPLVTVTQGELRRSLHVTHSGTGADSPYTRYYNRYPVHGSEVEVYSIPLHEIDIHDLMAVAVRCGAVEVWSSSSAISDWHPLGRPPHNDAELYGRGSPYSEFDKDKYFALFASEAEKQWLAVYDAIGLDALARIVTSLMLLARAGEVPKSLCEMAGAFEARHFPPEPGGHVSLRSLLYWVGIGEKGSLRQLQNAALKEKLFSYVPETMKGTLTLENLAIR